VLGRSLPLKECAGALKRSNARDSVASTDCWLVQKAMHSVSSTSRFSAENHHTPAYSARNAWQYFKANCVFPTPPHALHGSGGQVLLNVLQNAVKFSPNGSRIQIHVGVAEGVATITVRDHGPGVPAGELENIFERLYRTDTARSSGTGGSGLGLSISRALLRQMGGSIVVSLPECGGLAMATSLPIRYRGK
jgi:hypothetical protein